MNYIKTTVLIFFANCLFVYGQTDKFNFSVVYNPETEYHEIISTTTYQEGIYTGSEEVLKRLESMDITIKSDSKSQSKAKNVYQIGPLLKDSSKSFSLQSFIYDYGSSKYTQFSTSTGSLDKSNNMKIDSVVSHFPDTEEFKIDYLNQTQIAELFPKYLVTVGDSFTIEFPLTIINSEFEAYISAKSKYVVADLNGGFAYLTYTTTMDKSKIESEYPVDWKGTWEGILQYDIQNRFIVFAKTDAQSVVVVTLPDAYYTMKTEITSITEQETKKHL